MREKCAQELSQKGRFATISALNPLAPALLKVF
jgi:hypothetical protein